MKTLKRWFLRRLIRDLWTAATAGPGFLAYLDARDRPVVLMDVLHLLTLTAGGDPTWVPREVEVDYQRQLRSTEVMDRLRSQVAESFRTVRASRVSGPASEPVLGFAPGPPGDRRKTQVHGLIGAMSKDRREEGPQG